MKKEPNMRQILWNSTTKNVLKLAFFLLICIHSPLLSTKSRKKDYFEQEITELILRDKRKIRLIRQDPITWEVALFSKEDKKIWGHVYSEDFDTLWNSIVFVPVKKNIFELPIENPNGEKSSYSQVAIAIWHGGNAPTGTGVVFTVKEHELVVSDTPKYYIESGDPMYSGKIK